MQQVTPLTAGAAGAAALNMLAAVAATPAAGLLGVPRTTPASVVDRQANGSGTAGRLGADVAALSAKLLKMPPKKEKRKKAPHKVHLFVKFQLACEGSVCHCWWRLPAQLCYPAETCFLVVCGGGEGGLLFSRRVLSR
jgi:hypothetical protein